MKFASVLLAASLAVSSSAYAGVFGSTVTSQYYAFELAIGTPSTFVADNGAHANFDDIFDVTVTNNQIIYTFLDAANFTIPGSLPASLPSPLVIEQGNLLTFSGAPSLTQVTIDAASSYQDLDGYLGVTFNASQVAVNWNAVSFAAGDKVILNLTTTPVPEPENMAMLLAGLGLIAVMRRRYS